VIALSLLEAAALQGLEVHRGAHHVDRGLDQRARVRRAGSRLSPRTISMTSSSSGMLLSSWTATPGMASTIACSSSVQGRPLSSLPARSAAG
jgi:hypothetical protein